MTQTWTSYRRLADGSRWDEHSHASRADAVVAALEREADANRGYVGTPYPYYVSDGTAEERPAVTWVDEPATDEREED